MEKLNAILQISALLIVAFLIGFFTAWLYWRNKYRKKVSELENRLGEFNDENNRLQREISQLREEIAGMNKQLEKAPSGPRQATMSELPEPLYMTIVKNMGEGVSVSDDNGYFLVFNPRLEEITGYSRDEANQFREKLFLDALYPDKKLREKVAEHISNIPENGDYTNIKTEITTKNKVRKPVLVSSTRVSYENKMYYLSAYRDVSEKPEVEA
ncbi:MAG: PAS domain S-box protein [Bacteroidales bacterium]